MVNTLTVKKLQPAPGFLLVEPAKQEKKTASGLYLPDSHEEKPQYGTVLAVGGKLINDRGVEVSSPAKVGDTVLYKKWGGNEVEIGDTEYQFLKFDDILATILPNNLKDIADSLRDEFDAESKNIKVKIK
jgi:chaperonin GroES